MLVGSGSNGKSVFLKIIEALVGSENTSHMALQDLDTDRFAAAGLYCKMVNTFADLKQIKLSSAGNFKMLVSGDMIRAQEKFKDTHLIKIELMSNATTIDSALNFIRSKQEQQSKKTPAFDSTSSDDISDNQISSGKQTIF